MDLNLKIALERIRELESLADDRQVLIDLQQEDISERDIMIRSLRGQLQNLIVDRRYEVA